MPAAAGATEEPGSLVSALLLDAVPALTLGGALLAGDFALSTNCAAGALVAAAAVKIAAAQTFGRNQTAKGRPGRGGLSFRLRFDVAGDGRRGPGDFLGQRAGERQGRRADFRDRLGGDRAGARGGAPKCRVAAIGFHAGALGRSGLAIHWERFAPVALASVFGVALSLFQAARARRRRPLLARQSERQMAGALDSVSQSFALFDPSSRLIAGNGEFHRMFRLTEATAKDAALDDLLSKKLALRLKDRGVVKTLVATAKNIRRRECVMVELAEDRIMEFIFQPTPQGFSLMVEDVTSRRASELRIANMASRDDVTGLSNRSFCREKLEGAVERSKAEGDRFAVMVLDLDRFKQVNDSLGHPVGDKLLKRVAQRLRDMAGGDDVVARIGGDEFTILHFGAIDGAAEFAAKIIEALSEPYHVDGAKLMIGASVGVAIAPDDGAERRTN